MSDTDKVRAFADHLKGDQYKPEHVQLLRDLADEVDRLRVRVDQAEYEAGYARRRG